MLVSGSPCFVTVRPESLKVEAITAFATPQTKQDVRTFLGLTRYFQRFTLDCATTAAPWADLTRKSAPNLVRWTPVCDDAFAELESQMCSSSVLRCPDFSKCFIVQTDASKCGVGAVLSQLGDSGNDYPVLL